MIKKSRRRSTSSPRTPGPAATGTSTDIEASTGAPTPRGLTMKVVGLAAAVATAGAIGAYLLVERAGPPEALRTSAADGRVAAGESDVAFEDFVGSDACSGCHADQYDLWRESTHGHAGGPPTRENVISEFDGTTLRFSDAEVMLEVDPDSRFLYHVDQAGEERQTFEVSALVGGGHMAGGGTQTSFTRYSDGSLRLLPFDYARDEQIWFCDGTDKQGWIPIDGTLSLSDCGFWPPRSNFGQNCGNCHSSQMESRFDPDSQLEDVRYKSLAINCESCHGPGKRHVAIVGASNWQERQDIGMESLALRDASQSVQVCFRCHAGTQPLQPGYLPGKRYEEYYSTHFYMQTQRHGDGRVEGFGYQEGHLYSDCYLNGSMTCVNCHDPHSQRYRDVQRRPLPGKFDDAQCTSCHQSKVAAGERHTGHAPDSPGSRCVACHMPFLQQADMGQRVRYARSDHTIPIPRPAFDAALGVETACASCHEDKSVAWQQAQVDAQHGQLKPHKPIVKALLEVQSSPDPELAKRSLLADYAPHPAAQFDLLRSVGERIDLGGAALDTAVIAKLEQLAEDDDIDVSALALSFLHEGDDLHPELRQRVQEALAETGADAEAKRRRWSLWLGIRGSRSVDGLQVERGFATARKAAEIQEPLVSTRMAIAMGHSFAGRPAEALREYGAALASAATLEEHQTLLGRLCDALGDLRQSGMPPSDAEARLCDKSAWHVARPVPPSATADAGQE